ncbi:MAG: hypothetical protein OXE52_01785 [Chloroflexi bacterium]|nr:hypothetical protein [Chloroflexota bacterium]
MPIRYEWKDASKRVICYIAEGDWNWKDYHHAARASAFTLAGVDHPVDCLIDLRASARRSLPAGLAAHVRSFGRKMQACLTGRAVVIGMPKEGIDSLMLGDENTLFTSDGLVRFVANDAELEQALQAWAGHPPA